MRAAIIRPMSPRVGATRAAAVVALASAIPPGQALAHGLDGSAAGKSALEFLPLGIEHMLLGWDHLAFVCGVVLLAGNLVRAAKLISLFVAGHSTTLIIATLAEWQVSPTAVDVVIALSVLFVGVAGLRGRPEDWRPMYGAVLGFGLIHGFGLSTRLQDLGLPDDGELGRIIMFNIGLEVGQLAAIAVFVGLVTILTRHAPRWETVRRVAYGGLAAAGLIAAGVLSFPGDDDTATTASKNLDAACTQARSEPPAYQGGGHPKKTFFAAEETADPVDLVHVIGDGYVIVRYRPDLPAAQVQQLRAWVEGSKKALIGAPRPGQTEPVTAVAAYRTLRCSTFEFAMLETFAEEWFADVRAGTFR